MSQASSGMNALSTNGSIAVGWLLTRANPQDDTGEARCVANVALQQS